VELVLPGLAEHTAQAFLELAGQREGLSIAVELNRLPNVVDDDLAGIASSQVLFKTFADRRIDVTVDVIIQRFEQLFAFHRRVSLCVSPVVFDPRLPDAVTGFVPFPETGSLVAK